MAEGGAIAERLALMIFFGGDSGSRDEMNVPGSPPVIPGTGGGLFRLLYVENNRRSVTAAARERFGQGIGESRDLRKLCQWSPE